MLAQTCNIYAFGWVCDKDFAENIAGILREELRNGVVSIEDFLVQIRRFLILERQIAAEHGIQNDTATPDIRL